MNSIDEANRALASYLGLAIGDALGSTVEFMTGQEIRATYGIHRTMTGGGWLKLPPGAVTDDTQMALALGEALISTKGEWKLQVVADAYVAWMHSHPPDIGQTVRRGLRRYQLEGTLQAKPNEASAGNGGVMRNLPVIIAYRENSEKLQECSLQQSRITHHHPLADAGVTGLAEITALLLQGADKRRALLAAEAFTQRYPVFRFTPWAGHTSGYVVDTLQTVFDAFFETDSFEACLLRAVNRGGDADTIGALAGQLAGACYGYEAIPPEWLRKLSPEVRKAIEHQAAVLVGYS